MPRSGPSKDGTCIFCGFVGQLEREHVIAQWVRDVLGIMDDRKQEIRLGPNLDRSESWRRPIATKRVRCVCATCNHGWMKDLEDSVKPHLSALIRQGPVILPIPSTARLLVAWTLKTAAVAQEMKPNALKPIAAGACDHLRRTGEPLPGTTGWLLPANMIDAGVHIGTFRLSPNEIGYNANVALGRVRVSIIGPWQGRQAPYQPSQMDGVAPIQIWPHAPGVLTLPA